MKGIHPTLRIPFTYAINTRDPSIVRTSLSWYMCTAKCRTFFLLKNDFLDYVCMSSWVQLHNEIIFHYYRDMQRMVGLPMAHIKHFPRIFPSISLNHVNNIPTKMSSLKCSVDPFFIRKDWSRILNEILGGDYVGSLKKICSFINELHSCSLYYSLYYLQNS